MEGSDQKLSHDVDLFSGTNLEDKAGLDQVV